MRTFTSFLSRLRRDRRGISSVEYALLLAVISGAVIVAAETLSGAVEDELKRAAQCISGTVPAADC